MEASVLAEAASISSRTRPNWRSTCPIHWAMPAARTKSEPAPARRASAVEPPKLDAEPRETAAGAAAVATVASPGFDIGASLVAVNTANSSANETRRKSRKCQHRADQRRIQQHPPVPIDTRKPEARPVFTATWACLDDPASLRPLDRDSTATAELVPGSLIMDYTGTTTRVDLVGLLLPCIQNTHFLVPR